MKKIMFAAALAAALLLHTQALADKFVYSSDHTEAMSEERDLPMQGYNLTTGEIVYSLPRASDPVKAACGWFRVVMPEIPSGKVFHRTGYAFDTTEGTATVTGTYTDEKTYITVQKYSKLAIYQHAAALGKWTALEDWMKATTISNVNMYTAWNLALYITNNNELFTAAKESAAAAMGMTVTEVDALLKECEDGTESVEVK